MSRLLGITFDDSDAYAIQSLAATFGMEFDLVIWGRAVLDSGAGKVTSWSRSHAPNADAFADALLPMVSGYTHIAGVSSMASKDVLARLAGLVDAAMVTDVIAADSPTIFKRPMAAGTIIATVEVSALPVVLTFRPAGFAKQARGGTSEHDAAAFSGISKAEVTARSEGGGARPDLTQAKVIVSGGRPLKDAETFEKIIGGLADMLGGAVGATRAAVDSGIAANELQVGQTGKIVAPDLYIAAGISGSTQHMAGIKDSKLIVAVNKDPDAPIFEFADLGIVGDLFDVLPALQALIKQPAAP